MTQIINKNFLIRYKFNEDKKSSLIGAGRYWELVECKDLAERHFEKALASQLDKLKIKLRRGLTIEFITK